MLIIKSRKRETIKGTELPNFYFITTGQIKNAKAVMFINLIM